MQICIGAYLCIALFAIQLDRQWEFWVLAVFVGMFQGAIQALSPFLFCKNHSGREIRRILWDLRHLRQGRIFYGDDFGGCDRSADRCGKCGCGRDRGVVRHWLFAFCESGETESEYNTLRRTYIRMFGQTRIMGEMVRVFCIIERCDRMFP